MNLVKQFAVKTHWSDDSVLIRPYEPGDVDALFEAAQESVVEVGRWLPWCHPEYSRAESEAWVTSRPAAWAAREAYSFAIVDVAKGTFLGGCGLNTLHDIHGFANLGYWVRTKAATRGVATAATRLLARFGIQEVGLTRLEIVVAVGNPASMRVAEKVGARYEGVLRNRLQDGEGVVDAAMYSLIPEDFGLTSPRRRSD